MKKFLVAAVAALSITAACTSVESAKVDAATISSNGEAVAVVQATTLGIYLIFNFVALVESNLDVAVNKTLVTEAKALGGNKVQLLSVFEYPKGGLFKWFGPIYGLNIVNLSPSFASGVAVK